MARIPAFLALLLAGTLPLYAVDGAAQTKGGAKTAPAKGATAKAADKKNTAASTAQRLVKKGVEAYEAGKHGQAIRAFDTAMRGGGLSSQQVARALYYRGLAYRKQGKPGRAISDLTSAIWLKDGLSAPEKQEALASRVAAYHEAGINDAPNLSGATPMTGAQRPPAAPVTTPVTNRGGWQTAMTEPPAAMAPAHEPASAPAQSSSGSGGGTGGLFSSITNFFGGGSSSSSTPQDDAAPPPTASIASPAQAPQPAQPEVSSWSQTTEVAPAAPPATRTAAVAKKAPKHQEAKRARAPSGKYRLQVAAVRSRQEADLLVARLLTQHGGELGARQPEVDAAVIGSMGTFYRVRVGPYANSKEPKRLCNTLQASGFDCLVVTK